MDLPWGAETTTKFITNVGLITSEGPNGCDVMACEWTHHVSHAPGLVMVCIGPGKATHENISKNKEFGVSLCATDQTVLSSVAGGYSKKKVDKFSALKELGFNFYKAKKIDTHMVEGASLNLECKLIKVLDIGSHTMFIGEVLEASANPDKKSLAFHAGKYYFLEDEIPKPSDAERKKQKEIVEKYSKD